MAIHVSKVIKALKALDKEYASDTIPVMNVTVTVVSVPKDCEAMIKKDLAAVGFHDFVTEPDLAEPDYSVQVTGKLNQDVSYKP